MFCVVFFNAEVGAGGPHRPDLRLPPLFQIHGQTQISPQVLRPLLSPSVTPPPTPPPWLLSGQHVALVTERTIRGTLASCCCCFHPCFSIKGDALRYSHTRPRGGTGEAARVVFLFLDECGETALRAKRKQLGQRLPLHLSSGGLFFRGSLSDDMCEQTFLLRLPPRRHTAES